MGTYRFQHLIRGSDPRLKALFALWTGIMVWQAGLPGVLAYVFGLYALARSLSGLTGVIGLRLRVLLLPIGFWMLLKGLVDSLDREALWTDVVLETSLLGARLMALLLLGLILTWATSRSQLGLAVNWFLRPVLGRSRSWQGALAVSLMLHFIPLSLQTLRQVRQSILLRGYDLPFTSRIFVWVRTTLRVLSGKTWEQALALAARKLDHPGAWQGEIRFRPLEWSAGLLAAGAVFSLSLL